MISLVHKPIDSYKLLNSFDLKMIALVTMVIDHVGHVFFDDILWFRIIGRIAFILYAFLIAEGCFFTSDMQSYLKKLFIWALLSEIPYDLTFHNIPFYIGSQNIFFTLFLGVLSIHLIRINNSIPIQLFITAATLFLAWFLKVDYSYYGVATIMVFYFLRNFTFSKFALNQLLALSYSIFHFALQTFAFFGFLPIFFYSGKRGYKTGNIMYSFYAIHLLVIYLVKLIIFNI